MIERALMRGDTERPVKRGQGVLVCEVRAARGLGGLD